MCIRDSAESGTCDDRSAAGSAARRSVHDRSAAESGSGRRPGRRRGSAGEMCIRDSEKGDIGTQKFKAIPSVPQKSEVQKWELFAGHMSENKQAWIVIRTSRLVNVMGMLECARVIFPASILPDFWSEHSVLMIHSWPPAVFHRPRWPAAGKTVWFGSRRADIES